MMREFQDPKIFWGDIPANIGLNNRPEQYGRYLQKIGS
jgi:hypothetical protein